MVFVSRTFKGLVPVVGLFSLLALSLFMTGALIENSRLFDQYRLWLVGFIVLMLVVFALLIAVNAVGLIYAYVRKRIGSRLTLRLTGLFVTLMLIPALTVYWFSTWLVEKGMDSWFDANVETALQNSIDLSRWSLDSRMRSLHERAEVMADELAAVPNEIAPLTLEAFLGTDDDLGELMLLHSNREIIASVSRETASALVLPPAAVLREVAANNEPYAGLDPVGESGLYARFVFPVASGEVLEEPRFLQALYMMPERVEAMVENVEGAFSQYNQLVFLRSSLKQSFILTLTLVLLSGVLYAGWAAFYFARRLTRPIAILDEGTQAVAAGRLDTQLEATTKDEFGSLVESFNEMTRRLSVAQNSAEINRLQLERQRSYLQTVLEHVSSGVISLDEDMRLRTVNTAVCEILAVELERLINKSLHELAADSAGGLFPHLAAKCAGGEKEWREQLEYSANGRQRTLFCCGTHLPEGGHVIVINDVTDMVQAQRHRTWSEIARRMAHEFKNPLTPIQLSAERLNSKLGPALNEDKGALLRRSTTVITQQVEAMRRIVDDFSQFARAVPIEVRTVDVNRLVKDVVELYLPNANGVRIDCRVDAGVPAVHADAGRLRQLLHNLLTNAVEALENTPHPLITVTTGGSKNGEVEIQVRDNGPGFADDMLGKAFEPYVTNKPNGTGLGLAIVKRIVEEHNGRVQIENSKSGVRVRAVFAGARAGGRTGHHREAAP